MLAKLKQYRGVIGFILLAIGLIIAVHGNSEALQDSKERAKIVRGVICEILSASDKQAYAEIPAEVKTFHVSEAELQPFLTKQLLQTAEARRKLGTSTPANACYGYPTPPPKAP